MRAQNWPTKQEDMKVTLEILHRHGGEVQATLFFAGDTGDEETVQFRPSPWLAELVRNLVSRHRE